MPETEAQAAWADFAEELGTPVVVPESLAGGEGAEAAPLGEGASAPAEAVAAEAAPAPVEAEAGAPEA
jgi:hypothetical protein